MPKKNNRIAVPLPQSESDELGPQEHAGWQRWAERMVALQGACQYCGRTFLRSRKDAKFCSPVCKRQAYRNRVPVGVTCCKVTSGAIRNGGVDIQELQRKG